MFARRRDVLEREAERVGGVPVTGDVTSADDLEQLVSTAVERFGGVDIVVLNSGGPPRTRALDVTDEQLEDAARRLWSRRSGSSGSAARTSRQAATGA
jgi:3-oxoacyl-[acyl-carrier protein] reductase